eukprot:328657_1
MPKKQLSNKPEWNTFILSISFFLLFAAFNVIQTYATTYSPVIGSISFGIISILSLISSPFAAIIIHKLNFKYSFFITFIVYSSYTLGYIFNNDIYFLILSALCGISCPILWSSQGAILAQCSNIYEYQHNLKKNSEIGWFKGVFFALFAFHTVIGYLLGALFFYFMPNNNNQLFFIILSAMCFISCIFILFLQNISSEMKQITWSENENNNLKENLNININTKENNSTENNNSEENDNMLYSYFSGWTDSELICLIPLCAFQGIWLPFKFGEFPTIITGSTSHIFYVMTCYGIFGTIFAYIGGKASDKFGCFIVVFLSNTVVVILLSVLLCYELNDRSWNFYGYNLDKYSLIIWIICGCILGIGGGPLLNQQISILIAKLLGNQPTVFAKRSMITSVTGGLGFFYHHYLSMKIKIINCMCLCVLGVICLLIHPKNRNICN